MVVRVPPMPDAPMARILAVVWPRPGTKLYGPGVLNTVSTVVPAATAAGWNWACIRVRAVPPGAPIRYTVPRTAAIGAEAEAVAVSPLR